MTFHTTSAARNIARRTAALKGLGTGANLAAKLEKLYKAIQARHPELPDVVIITGSGLNAKGLILGHFGHDFWLKADGVIAVSEDGGIIDDTRMGELFIAGETLHYGAERVLQTLIHEAAHVLGKARGVENTNASGRHLVAFRTLAEELGLAWPEGKKAHPTLGYSDMHITDETLASYAKELVDFAADLPVTMDTLVRLGLVLADPKDTGSEAPKLAPLPTGIKAPRKGVDRNNLRLECGCGRVLRMSRKALEEAPVICGRCEERFSEC